MKLGDIRDVLTFAAFRPEPDDRQSPWVKRFNRKKSLFLNVGRTRTSWRGFAKNGKLAEGGSQEGEFKEIAQSQAEEWKGLTDDGWCGVSINARYVIGLESNVSRKPGVEDLIRTNPRSILGARYEKGKRYALTNNPESIATVLLTVDEDQIKGIENQLSAIGLKAGRICCGTYAMLRDLLSRIHVKDEAQGAESAEPERKSSSLNIVCCEGSVCAMLENRHLWTDLRSRTDLYSDGDLEPAFDVLQPLIARLDEESVIRFVADSNDSPILAELKSRLPQAEIEDLSSEDHLWKVLTDQ